MVDAKLIAVTLTIGMVVSLAINYVGRESTATSIDYTDDWDTRLDFICRQFLDDGTCFPEMCKHFQSGGIDSTTPMLVQCLDGSYRSPSLRDLHNADDWYERARGEKGNTGDALKANAEYCASTEGENDATGFTFDGAETVEGMAGCAFAVPIFAAVVDAEYTRWVSKSHIREFQAGFDLFCAMPGDDIVAGCAQATFGFRDQTENFTAVCEDGTHAIFDFHQTVMALDHYKNSDASDAEVEAFIRGHCGNTEGDARRLGLRKFSDGETHEPWEEELVEEVVEGKAAEGLRNMLKSHAVNELRAEGEDGEKGRQLWGHRHSPHGHSPHGHTPHVHWAGDGDAYDCYGCGNICGNKCFGRCGAGCERWNACGGAGRGSHRACVEHDYECSCGSSAYQSCWMLLVQGLGSMIQDVAGGHQCVLAPGFSDNCNADAGAPGGIAKVRHCNGGVISWGQKYGIGSWTSGNNRACTRVNMHANHGGYRLTNGQDTIRWNDGQYARNTINDGAWDNSHHGDGHGTAHAVASTAVAIGGVVVAFLTGF